MADTVFITGGTGFVGSAVIKELLERGYSVTALARDKASLPAGVRTVAGDLFNNAALDDGMAGCSAVIHLVGIIMENRAKGVTFERIHTRGTQSVVNATERNGIRRYVHMSALGTRGDARSKYHQTKFLAEQLVRNSALDWTIIRPSLIHGPKGEFMRMEANWARRKSPPFLFMPYFGAGAFGQHGAGLLQPIFVDDVARAFVDALEKPKTIGEVYPIGGPDRVTWPQLHHITSKHIVGRERLAFPVPAWYAKLITHLAPAALLPFNRDQVLMSQEDNICDISKLVDDLGWAPQPFESSFESYAKQM